MKTIVTISIVLNLGFAALIFALANERKAAPEAVTPTATEHQALALEAASLALRVSAQSESKSFHGNPLESADYGVYVKNLRASGFPDRTVRAIVTADLDTVYAAKRSQMEQELLALQNGSTSESAEFQQDLRSQLQNLPAREASQLQALLDTPPAPAAAPVTAQAAPTQTSTDALAKSLAMPLVFQNVDVTSLNLTDQQKQALDTVRQEFAVEVGTTQNPNDPAYMARWQKAQPEADHKLEELLGHDLYTTYQLLAGNRELARR